jgi:hypothetical protein
MNLSTQTRALCRGLLAGAVVLAGVSACSRSDRADTGRDTTQSGAATVSPADTSTGAMAQPSTGAAAQDTTSASGKAETSQPRSTARTNTTVETKAADDSVSGYRAMGRDTATAADVSDTASAEMAGAAAAAGVASAAADEALTDDTVPAGSSEMARDTSSAAGLGDTATVAVTDTSVTTESDTTGNIEVQVDTTTMEQAQADTVSDNRRAGAGAVAAAAAGAAASDGSADVSRDNAGANADVPRDNAGRVRPPEDSTEILGNVTTDSTATNGDVARQSESDHIRPPEDSTEIRGAVTSDEDRAAVGAAAMGRTVTGPEAVPLMSQAGERCIVLNEESTEAAWDISDSPANLNPCGPGTMTLSPVRTGETH